jgi:hypothetical protein
MANSELENLRDIYLAARDTLLKTIINTKGVGTKTYYNTVLKRLNKLIKELEEKTDGFISSEIPKEYKKSLDETYDYFKRNNLEMKPPAAFASIHNDAVNLLAREMQYSIKSALGTVGRQVIRYLDESRDEALRRTGLLEAGIKAASGGTIVDMKKSMVKRLQEQGFMTVQYGSGPNARQVPLDVYAMLCARSTTREAGNTAREIQLTENGYDLMEMTEHFPTCEVCAALQGKVYSISGNDKRFPPLSMVYRDGYHNVHPNCRHVMVPFIEEFNDVEAAIKRSNAPYKPNPENVKVYDEQQAKNRRERETLYQYERYKMRLGDDAPKSLSAFKRIKSAGGERWESLQKRYRIRLKEDTDSAIIKNVSENIGMKGIIELDPVIPDISSLSYDASHIEDRHHGVTRDEAVSYIRNARVSVTRWNGKFKNYYSDAGAAYVDMDDNTIRTAFKSDEYDEKTVKMMEELKRRE